MRFSITLLCLCASTLVFAEIPCPETSQTPGECMRKTPGYTYMGTGFAGGKDQIFSLKRFGEVGYSSPFGVGYSLSPYASGGLLIPKKLRNELTSTSLKEVPAAPTALDTPSTVINWERGGLELNGFRLAAERMLTQHSYLVLDMQTHRADSLPYSYAFQVHQPYLSGVGGLEKWLPFLDRDSASMVINGNSMDIQSLHLRPRLGVWLTPKILTELYWDGVNNKTQIASPVSGEFSQLLYDEETQNSLSSEFVHSVFGGRALFSFNGSESQARVSHGTARRSPAEQNHNSTYDEVMVASVWKSPLNPKIEAGFLSEQVEGSLYTNSKDRDGEGGLINPRSKGWEDQEYLLLSAVLDTGLVRVNTETKAERHSGLHNRQNLLWSYGASAGIDFPLGLSLEAEHSQLQKMPHWTRRFVINPSVFHYANPDLSYETIRHFGTDGFFRYRFLKMGAGTHYNVIQGSALPQALPFSGVANTPDSVALKYVNYSDETRWIGSIHLGFALGNWSVGLTNNYLMNNMIEGSEISSQIHNRNATIPKKVFQGGLSWGNRFVEERLRVKVKADWAWFSKRYAWRPLLDGQSEVVKLDEFLSLDFTAEMQIKEFLLYYQIKNMNHDRYTLDPGNHPPGVNFRWGVHWALRG